MCFSPGKKCDSISLHFCRYSLTHCNWASTLSLMKSIIAWQESQSCIRPLSQFQEILYFTRNGWVTLIYMQITRTREYFLGCVCSCMCFLSQYVYVVTTTCSNTRALSNCVICTSVDSQPNCTEVRQPRCGVRNQHIRPLSADDLPGNGSKHGRWFLHTRREYCNL